MEPTARELTLSAPRLIRKPSQESYMRAHCFAIVVLVVTVPGVAAQQASTLVADPARHVLGTRGADAEAFNIRSSILDQTRRVNVVFPASYANGPTSRRYPVMIVLDGEANVPATAAVADELARNGMIPEAIIVAIENTDGTRGRVHDLTPPGLSVSGSSLSEGGDRFLDFIERELLPAVDRQLRGGEPRTFIGHSSGAILVTYAAATRSTYRAVIAIDAPIGLGENWLARKLTERAATRVTPLRYVSLESRFGWTDTAWQTLVATAPASWKLRREALRLEGHETLYMLGAYLGLREVFSDYSRLVAQEKPAAEVLPYYVTISNAFGGRLPPPKRLLRDVMDDLIVEGRGAGARAAYEMLVQTYGAPPDDAQIRVELADAERKPEPTETVASLLATPFPTPAEASRFIGDWVGSHWMSPDEPRNQRETLRIRVEAGRVVGELLNPEAPPEHRVRTLDYLRVTPAGLTYGLLNGMRPRGVVLWEGTLIGDTLAGKQRWGGVASPYPPDTRVDPGFLFTRVRK
jgi:hypothetical protein